MRIRDHLFWLPVLLAALAPFANFAAENAGEDMSIVWLLTYALGICMLGLVFVLVFLPFGRRTASRFSFVVSVFVLLFFSFAVVQHVTGAKGLAVYAIHGVLTLIACYLAWRFSKHDLAWRAWLVVLIAMVIMPSAMYAARVARLERTSQEWMAAETKASEPKVFAKNPRNVYYFTLDAYARADSLRDFLGFDNADFLDLLKSKGFFVSERSYANYKGTLLSTSTALQMDFVVLEDTAYYWDMRKVFEDIFNGKGLVFKRFKGRGYFVAKLNWTNDCSKGAYIDYCHGNDKQQMRVNLRLTELEINLLRMTPVHDLLTKQFRRFFHRHLGVKDLRHVTEMVRYVDGSDPKFFYGHVLSPHPPYRFTADCGPSDEINTEFKDDAWAPEAKQLYLDAIQCANKMAKELINLVVQKDPEAIVLLNSDHGPAFTVNWTLPYEDWPESSIRERFGILNAMRLPPECKDLYYDSISPVNFFELVFACIEQREPNFLKDRIYISTFDKEHPRYGQVWRYR